VYRVPAAGPPLDHTSVLKTVQQRWGLPPLTARDAAAPGFGDALTLTAARTDDVLAGVTVPVAAGQTPSAAAPSHLQEVQADLISRRYPAGQHDDANALPAQGTNAAYSAYIHRHSELPAS
jgi:phospholipase C